MSIQRRIRLPNRQLGQIIHVHPELELPPNARWANGATRQDQAWDALRILHDYPAVNAVVMNAPPRADIEETVDHFYQASPLARIRPVFKNVSDISVRDRLGAYFNNRAQNPNRDPHKPRNVSGCGFERMTEYSIAAVSDAYPDKKIAQLKGSMITFVPVYKGSWGEDDFVNTHIDTHYDFDVRIVECSYGSTSLLFNDKDFQIVKTEEEGRSIMQPLPISDVIDGWAIPRGGSLAIRTPSQRNLNEGAKPTVHAHGLGLQDGPEKRLTIRHDYSFV